MAVSLKGRNLSCGDTERIQLLRPTSNRKWSRPSARTDVLLPKLAGVHSVIAHLVGTLVFLWLQLLNATLTFFISILVLAPESKYFILFYSVFNIRH